MKADLLTQSTAPEGDLFRALGLSEPLARAVSALGYVAPTPIQAAAIPQVVAGRDVLGLSQTGGGKTAAFGLPMLERLAAEPARPAPKSARALVLAPTRELAGQIADNLKRFAEGRRVRLALVVGGASMNRQRGVLAPGVDLLVATPGRLIDLMDRGDLRLDQTRLLVLDEADQMLDLGFIHALRRIARNLPNERQTLMFSATMPKSIAELAATYLRDPVRVEAQRPGKAPAKIDQTVAFVDKNDKPARLIEALRERSGALSLVFTRTKHGADRLTRRLEAAGVEARAIHGNKSQNQRERAIRDFRSGALNVLVATDVAARGVDIQGVGTVFNYELPDTPETYVHRIGRTGRAGADGEAIAFCAPEERKLLKQIEKLLGRTVPRAGGSASEEPVETVQTPPRGRPKSGEPRAPGAGKSSRVEPARARRDGRRSFDAAADAPPKRRRRRRAQNADAPRPATSRA